MIDLNIKTLKERILLNNKIQLLYFHQFDGIDKDYFKSLGAENFIDDLLPFFSMSNGLQLMWIYKNNPEFDNKIHFFYNDEVDWLEPLEKYNYCDGCINILPLEMILTHNWKNIVWFDSDKNYDVNFNNQNYNLLEFKLRVRPFDLFSKENCASLFTTTDKNSLKVLLGSDHYIEYSDSKQVSFKKYIDFVFKTMGSVDKRIDWLSIDW